jgi:hypothetical protein
MVCHVLLVETGNGPVLIDTGFGPKDCDGDRIRSEDDAAESRSAHRAVSTPRARHVDGLLT